MVTAVVRRALVEEVKEIKGISLADIGVIPNQVLGSGSVPGRVREQ